MGGIKRLFYDIETSPNIVFSWRTGNKLHISHDNIIQERSIICICYKWENQNRVYSITWDNGDDKNLVKEFSDIVSSADEIIAHNGDKFDYKWLNGRNLIHGLPPIPKAKTIDTLKLARKHFYFNSNTLDYLSKVLLGEGKMETTFGLWKDICLLNDQTALRKMVRYCKKDVELLQRIWEKLREYDAPATHAAVFETGNMSDRWMCPYCGSPDVSLSKTRPTPRGIVQRQMQCGECHRYYTIADSVFKNYLVAKEGVK